MHQKTSSCDFDVALFSNFWGYEKYRKKQTSHFLTSSSLLVLCNFTFCACRLCIFRFQHDVGMITVCWCIRILKRKHSSLCPFLFCICLSIKNTALFYPSVTGSLFPCRSDNRRWTTSFPASALENSPRRQGATCADVPLVNFPQLEKRSRGCLWFSWRIC